MADSTPKEVPWHAAYPAPKSVVAALPRHELLQWFRDGKKAGKDFVLVDVRRTDFEVCIDFDLMDDLWVARVNVLYQIKTNMIGLGWHHSWLYQSASTQSLPNVTSSVCASIL